MSSMRISLDVEFSDGRSMVAVAELPDIIAFERQYGIGISDVGDNPRLEWLAFLAWTALKRRGQAGDDFEGWLSQTAGLGLANGDDTAAPLVQAPE